MGFLLGALGKQMAGKRVRQLQARMMSVQSQMRRAAREVADLEKYFSSYEKNMKNQLSQWGASIMAGYQMSQMAGNFEALGIKFNPNDPNGMQTAMAELTQKAGQDSSIWQGFSGMQNMNMYAQQSIQSMVVSMQTALEQQIEMQKEMYLQPAKDLEEDLQTEKDSLETQIQLAQQDYEACKEMEKAGAQNMKPNYTGQG